MAICKDNRNRKRKYIWDYKEARGCAECGYNEHPVALQLDHIDPALGKHRRLRSSGWDDLSWSDLEEELTKCQVLCANCHAIKTYRNKDHLPRN